MPVPYRPASPHGAVSRVTALACVTLLLTAGLAAGAEGSRAGLTSETSADRSIEDVEVRRWEYVVIVRIAHGFPGTDGRAVDAAHRSGGAVLDQVVDVRDSGFTDHRLLIRTREPQSIDRVLSEIRREQGVLGAASTKLPETPTWAGGPSFLTAWTGESTGVSNAGRIMQRADHEPVLDKRDLLEITEVPVGPTQAEAGALGGFSLNVSQMFHDARVALWLRRERRLREGYLPILPEPQTESRTAAPATPGDSTP